jgi:hypothetical protein
MLCHNTTVVCNLARGAWSVERDLGSDERCGRMVWWWVLEHTPHTSGRIGFAGRFRKKAQHLFRFSIVLYDSSIYCSRASRNQSSEACVSSKLKVRQVSGLLLLPVLYMLGITAELDY